MPDVREAWVRRRGGARERRKDGRRVESGCGDRDPAVREQEATGPPSFGLARRTPSSLGYPVGNGECRNVPVAVERYGNRIRQLCSGFGLFERLPRHSRTAMVRKGSPVRVRQRASETVLQRGFLILGAARMTPSRRSGRGRRSQQRGASLGVTPPAPLRGTSPGGRSAPRAQHGYPVGNAWREARRSAWTLGRPSSMSIWRAQ